MAKDLQQNRTKIRGQGLCLEHNCAHSSLPSAFSSPPFQALLGSLPMCSQDPQLRRSQCLPTVQEASPQRNSCSLIRIQKSKISVTFNGGNQGSRVTGELQGNRSGSVETGVFPQIPEPRLPTPGEPRLIQPASDGQCHPPQWL